MITMAISAITSLLEFLNGIEIKTQVSLDDLPCRVTELNETQDYGVPTFPVESGTYKGDTIYKMPLKLNARLFVKSGDYLDFEKMIDEINFNKEFLTIKSLNGKIYKNLKIVQFARDTNTSMMGAVYYNLALQEMQLFSALATAKPKQASYSGKKSNGSQEPQEKESSSLFKGGQGLGAWK